MIKKLVLILWFAATIRSTYIVGIAGDFCIGTCPITDIIYIEANGGKEVIDIIDVWAISEYGETVEWDLFKLSQTTKPIDRIIINGVKEDK